MKRVKIEIEIDEASYAYFEEVAKVAPFRRASVEICIAQLVDLTVRAARQDGIDPAGALS